MKMHNILYAATATGLMISGSQISLAAGLNVYDEAQLVPWVHYSGGNTTAVGLLARADGTVRWSFYDENGNQRHSGDFSIVANDFRPFIWNSEAAGAATSLSGVNGYLLFALDTNGDGMINGADTAASLGANAFYVDASNGDVMFIPVFDLDEFHLSEADTTNWANNPISQLGTVDGKSADTGDTLDIQYIGDGATGGIDTNIYIWSTGAPPSSSAATVYDGAGASKAITVPLLNDNLNVLNMETNTDVTASFNNGYMRWTVPALSSGNAVVVFSIAIDPNFSAAQTLNANYVE